nr:PREDICTED: protein FAM111A-like [Paralichthys olivaceus]
MVRLLCTNKSDNLKEERNQSAKPTLVQKEEEPHPTHSFEWKSSGKTGTLVSCQTAGTVEDSLKRNAQFRGIAKKNKDKELVLIRNGKAISSHFPCSLIKEESLTVKYIKASPEKQDGGSVHVTRKGSSDEVLLFHVLVRGGKNIVRIMRNPELKSHVQEITIFAFKDETVKHALRRDARFLNIIFQKNCMLSNISTEATVDMANLVDNLGDNTYRIILGNNLPASLPSSLEEDFTQTAESQRADSGKEQDPSEQSVNDNANTSGHTAPKNTPMPSSEKMKRYLSSEFEYIIKGKKTVQKLSRTQNLLHVEYGKNAQTCTEVKTMKKLMDLSNSVCQVRINGRPMASGFLLFDKFVLTNGHVVNDNYNDTERQLDARVIVHFSYESLDQTERGQDLVEEVEVEEVAGFEFSTEQMYDWALLKLKDDVRLPYLLNKCGYINQSHGVCIIGHPDGGVKKIDPCLIIASEKRIEVVDKSFNKNRENIQLITQRFFDGVAKYVEHQKNVLTYKTCFYGGSSGSPVFDKDCKVLAMHSGGYLYEDTRGATKSVIEFGYPLSNIIERIIIQLVEREKLDVLSAYLASDNTHLKTMRRNVKKLVESRNLTTFKAVVSRPLTTDDERLKELFEFFRQKEEPVPMEF